jgi:hypothetical protein
MKKAVVQMIRAHLIVVSIAASIIDVIVLCLIFTGRVPQADFESFSFRCFLIAALVLILLAIRIAAHIAYRRALCSGHACDVDRGSRVWVADDCPRRYLVVLHLQLNAQACIR